MKIILAKAAGFCMGVRRAMQIVIDQSQRGPKPVRTQGPLIHNPQVIEMLRGKGVEILDKSRPPDGRGTVVVRAHGVAPDEIARLCGCGFQVVDATCPHVIRIQKLITRHLEQGGGAVIIVGDHGHAEVEGLLGYARGAGQVVATPEDVDALPADLERVCVVSQTTQSPDHFELLLERIRGRWPDCQVHRTICGSTDRRQRETIEIARQVDAMIVVGGRNSANTVRLAELAAETGTPTYHVETSDELDFPLLHGLRTVGVTAGASTPNWMIVEVMERLRGATRRDLPPAARALFNGLDVLLHSHLYSALGALCMGLGCVAMHPLTAAGVFPTWSILVSALFIFAMYALNLPTEQQSERYRDPLRWRFHQRWGRVLARCGAGALAAALALSWLLGPWAFGLLCLGAVLGIFYRFSSLPGPLLPFLRHRRLADIPGSKDLFMALAWAAAVAFLPLVSRPVDHQFLSAATHLQAWIGSAVTCFFVFVLVFVRSVVFDLREIESDQIVGRETMPILLGKEKTKTLLLSLIVLLLLVMAGAVWGGALTSAGTLMLLPIAYTAGYLYLYHRRAIQQGLFFEAIVGGKFLLVGILAALWLRAQ